VLPWHNPLDLLLVVKLIPEGLSLIPIVRNTLGGRVNKNLMLNQILPRL